MPWLALRSWFFNVTQHGFLGDSQRLVNSLGIGNDVPKSPRNWFSSHICLDLAGDCIDCKIFVYFQHWKVKVPPAICKYIQCTWGLFKAGYSCRAFFWLDMIALKLGSWLWMSRVRVNWPVSTSRIVWNHDSPDSPVEQCGLMPKQLLILGIPLQHTGSHWSYHRSFWQIHHIDPNTSSQFRLGSSPNTSRMSLLPETWFVQQLFNSDTLVAGRSTRLMKVGTCKSASFSPTWGGF